ncbi:MAG: protein phosphatase 2C domain-containing protein [Dolichospermum sp. DET50]|nr:protein phosphatase 2C domain-containing protein [Dolichospermum sp. DET66]MBS3033800.1 protein phosphatase 2C domain-containing protein [Dolichospermum sp. DET67]MBS3039003.1 protein phosphatase 2C domain-containing protein [Dolichospermum sp. DET50]QSX66255.1 MAG: protein phosphatase 2C domain-containing protein [Dolichospermum sp. DET69]
MSWKAIARSAVGTSHQAEKIPCQDCGNYRIFNDVIVGAVADGAGSAKYSQIGSELAVDTALNYLKGNLNNRKKFWENLSKPLTEKEVKKLFNQTFKKVIKELNKQGTNKGDSVNDLACTLLVFIATPEWVAAMQIGDGFMIVHPQDSEYQLLFKPDKGEFFNETTFVTSANAVEEMQVQVISGNQEFICASTDGLEKVAIRLSDWKPFPPFFKPFEEYLRETNNPEEDDQYIIDFLNSERLNSRTDDDKTLVLCLFEN